MNPLPPRQLGRTARPVSPFIWAIRADDRPEVLEAAASRGADWIILDASLTDAALTQLQLGQIKASIVLGLDGPTLQPRQLTEPARRLSLLGCKRCLGGIIQGIAADEVKAGWPFHRMGQLRDRGMIEVMLADAADYAAGEWLVDHSPAQGVALDYDMENQLAAYRLLDSAAEMDTAIVAKVGAGIENARFALSDPRIASVMVRLPRTLDELEEMLEAAMHPMDDSIRKDAWEEYQVRVPAPPRPRGAHPPE